jgi:ribosomal protein S18 acetylase RimI-like enzyme
MSAGGQSPARTTLDVRNIQPDELSWFTAEGVSSASREGADELRTHLEDAFRTGKSYPEWCFVAGDHTIAGRLCLWQPPGNPIYIYVFDINAATNDPAAVGRALLDAAVRVAPATSRLLYALDQAEGSAPDLRAALLEQAGFAVARRGLRWEWTAGNSPRILSPRPSLVFRTLVEVGDDAFRRAIAEVSDGTLDARLREMRQRLGRAGDAAEHFSLLSAIPHEPHWWQLAFDGHGDLVGLFVTGQPAGKAVIAYVGVAPAQRGHQYVDDLVAAALLMFQSYGEAVVRADTDQANKPMNGAFLRAGFRPFATRTEYIRDGEAD